MHPVRNNDVVSPRTKKRAIVLLYDVDGQALTPALSLRERG
jgi:hypothetical protein